MSRTRSRRLVGALATAAGIPLLALAFASPASVATVGDWAVSPAKYTLQPGSVTTHEITVTCISAGGCDYVTADVVEAFATSGATFDDPSGAGIPLALISATGSRTDVGTCGLTSTSVHCAVNSAGHANQGDKFVAGPGAEVLLHVPASVAPDTQLVWDHIASSNANQDNDNGYGYSPTVDGSPMADGAIGGGALGGLALLAGAGVLARRRKVSVTY